MGEIVLFHDVNVGASGFAGSQINESHPSDSEEKNTFRDGGKHRAINCLHYFDSFEAKRLLCLYI